MKLEKLSPELEDLIPQVVEEWLDIALLGGDEIDDKAACQGLEWLYQFSGLSKPITLIVDSPMAAQVAIPIAKEMLKNLNGSQVESQVESQVWSQVWSQVGSQVRSQVWSQVGSQVGSLEQFAYNTVSVYAGWCSWVDFFERIGVANQPNLKEYMDFMKSGAFMGIYLDGLAIVCRRPSGIRRDASNALHYDHGPAIEWRDGYKLHYLHGVYFEEDIWQKIVNEEITLESLGTIKNADQRAVAVQMLRPDRLLEQVKAKLVHTGAKQYNPVVHASTIRAWAKYKGIEVSQHGVVPRKVIDQYSESHKTRLYQVDNFMDTGETEYCMLMEHPTIPGKQYIEWVEPKVGAKKDADLCQAVAFGMTKEQYLEAVEA